MFVKTVSGSCLAMMNQLDALNVDAMNQEVYQELSVIKCLVNVFARQIQKEERVMLARIFISISRLLTSRYYE